MDDLVSTGWLEQKLGEPDLAIIDASMFMPGDKRDPAAEFAEAHIPGARFLDIEALSDPDDPAPHMLPGPSAFGVAMRALGVGRDDRIVVYDNSPLRSAARGWFMLRHYGAGTVAILDGGFQKWRAEYRPVEKGPAQQRTARFDAVERSQIVTKQMLLRDAGLPILDARGRGRFEGSEDDPRPGVAAGHIPGARNLPFSALYRDDGTLRPDEELRAGFTAAGVDPESPFIASCGSGVTAGSLIFAARRLGGRDARLYDGSWSEWGADPATPKARGAA
ncbi:MAG: 3-mercaptopyruvate sulfurtransferase [Pseudomonadota bacterium]|nr:3-mercaptopyruvate sulfurtransferase [Pseudomonadota bacterium]